jgi:hypothetical protein
VDRRILQDRSISGIVGLLMRLLPNFSLTAIMPKAG